MTATQKMPDAKELISQLEAKRLGRIDCLRTYRGTPDEAKWLNDVAEIDTEILNVMRRHIKSLTARMEGLEEERAEYMKHILCVYCGAKMDRPPTIAESLEVMKAHVLMCPKHPAAVLATRLADAEKLLAAVMDEEEVCSLSLGLIEKIRKYRLGGNNG